MRLAEAEPDPAGLARARLTVLVGIFMPPRIETPCLLITALLFDEDRRGTAGLTGCLLGEADALVPLRGVTELASLLRLLASEARFYWNILV